VGAGEAVEVGDVSASPGEEPAVVAGVDVSCPGVDCAGEGLEAVGCGVDAVVAGVPADGEAGVAVAEVGEGSALVRVVLAEVLVEADNGAGVADEDGVEGTAGSDGAELVGVADEDGLGAGGVDGDEQPLEVGVGGHAGFVENDQGAGVEPDALPVELPQQRGEGAGVRLGVGGECARGLAAGRATQDLPAGGLVGVAGGVDGGGLAGAGDAFDDGDAPLPADRSDGGLLPGGELSAQIESLAGEGGLGVAAVDGLGPGGGEVVHGAGDGVLGGEHVGGAEGALAGAVDADERDDGTAGEHRADVHGKLVYGPPKTYAHRSVPIPAQLADELASTSSTARANPTRSCSPPPTAARCATRTSTGATSSPASCAPGSIHARGSTT
jgi:hypothetical protein